MPSANMNASSGSALVDAHLQSLTNWRGNVISKVRDLIKCVAPDVVEEMKWAKPSNPGGVPTWYRDGLICTAECYRDKVKFTFAKGASIPDPHGLFNSSLGGGTRRAIDVRESDRLDEERWIDLIRAAIAVNSSAAARKANKN